jgi:hypothetical protein
MVNADKARYTDSRLRLLRRSLLRFVACSAASGSGLFGSMLPGGTACRAMNAEFPKLVWWRDGAKAGVAAAETFANQSQVS